MFQDYDQIPPNLIQFSNAGGSSTHFYQSAKNESALQQNMHQRSSSNHVSLNGLIYRQSNQKNTRTNSRSLRRNLGNFGGTCFSNPTQITSQNFNKTIQGFNETQGQKIYKTSTKKYQLRVEKFQLSYNTPDVKQKEYHYN